MRAWRSRFCEWRRPGPRSATSCVRGAAKRISSATHHCPSRSAKRGARAGQRATVAAAAAELFYDLIKQNTFGRFVRRTRYVEEMLCDRTRIAAIRSSDCRPPCGATGRLK